MGGRGRYEGLGRQGGRGKEEAEVMFYFLSRSLLVFFFHF